MLIFVRTKKKRKRKKNIFGNLTAANPILFMLAAQNERKKIIKDRADRHSWYTQNNLVGRFHKSLETIRDIFFWQNKKKNYPRQRPCRGS